MSAKKMLITGATGLSGSFILKELVNRHAAFSSLVRDRNKVKNIRDFANVTFVEGDMLQPETLSKALEDVEKALLVSTSNDRMVETQCSFIDACKTAGVAHVIKFSGEESQTGYNPQNFRFTREHEQIEDYLENSGLSWTHLRPSQFMQMYLRKAVTIKNAGALLLPLEKITMSPVDLEDVAKVAASVLIDGGYLNQSLRLTGPEALSMANIAAIIAKVTGSSVEYVPVSGEDRKQMMIRAGLPMYLVDAITDQAAERRRNPKAFVDLRTFEALGIAPKTFEQFVQRHKADFGKA